MSRASSLLSGLAVVAWAVASCSKGPSEEESPKRFRPLLSPAGVPDVTEIADESIDQADRFVVKVRLLAPKTIRYQQIDWLLDSVHRQAAKRIGFQFGRRPQAVDIRIYDDAKALPERYIARVRSEGREPVKDIRVPYPLGAEVEKMISERPDYKKRRPTAESDDKTGKLTVRVPYVDGRTDEYLPKLSYVRALREWSVWTLDLFDKYPALADLTFIGEHRGKEVVHVQITRDQFSDLGLRAAEEGLGAYQGEFLGGLVTDQISEEKVERKMDERRKEVYRELLGELPREQVRLAPSLR